MKRAGQIVLFRFPQADLQEGKLRPALLLAKLPGEHGDWLICMISSQVRHYVPEFDEIVREEDSDFATSGLKVASVIRVGRLAVVEADILLGAAGSTVNVPINLSDGSNISALGFTLTFDPAIISIPSRAAVTRGSLVLANFSLSANTATAGKVLIIIAPPLESPVPTLTAGSGSVAVIGFQVAAGAAVGASSPLRFTLVSASDPRAETVRVSTQDGTFAVRP